MSGITDRTQAIILTISIFLISLPTVLTVDPNLKIILFIAGLVGIALKEGLGNKPSQSKPDGT